MRALIDMIPLKKPVQGITARGRGTPQFRCYGCRMEKTQGFNGLPGRWAAFDVSGAALRSSGES